MKKTSNQSIVKEVVLLKICSMMSNSHTHMNMNICTIIIKDYARYPNFMILMRSLLIGKMHKSMLKLG